MDIGGRPCSRGQTVRCRESARTLQTAGGHFFASARGVRLAYQKELCGGSDPFDTMIGAFTYRATVNRQCTGLGAEIWRRLPR